jgi:hypothetical protein
MARTRDFSPAAHYEHTVLITHGEPEILTQPENILSQKKSPDFQKLLTSA